MAILSAVCQSLNAEKDGKGKKRESLRLFTSVYYLTTADSRPLSKPGHAESHEENVAAASTSLSIEGAARAASHPNLATVIHLHGQQLWNTTKTTMDT